MENVKVSTCTPLDGHLNVPLQSVSVVWYPVGAGTGHVLRLAQQFNREETEWSREPR